MKEPMTTNRPAPLLMDPTFMQRFLLAVGDPDTKVQAKLRKDNGFKYRTGVGEVIYAMSTCRLDLSFAAIKCSQSSACPHADHYKALKQTLRYMYATREEGI